MNETEGEAPLQRDYPLSLSLDLPTKDQVKADEPTSFASGETAEAQIVMRVEGEHAPRLVAAKIKRKKAA